MAFITNQDKGAGFKVGKRIGELMDHSANLDMLVGFFYFSGVKVMSDAFARNPNLKLRVLVGMDADTAFSQLVEVVAQNGGDSNADVRDRFYTSLQKILGSEIVDTQAFHERLEIFIRLLDERRLDMRKTREPNHAKLYIFSMDDSTKNLRQKVFITGSSNFSEPGLSLRDEFNVEVSDYGTDEAQAYFDALWADAVPLTDTDVQRKRLMDILMHSSVAANVTPFEAYYLVMKTYLEHQKAQLRETQLDNILTRAGFSKYRYQVDAVAQAMAKLDAYRGVIIADVVGLGKSVIASSIAAMRGRRGLIIAPPGLLGDKTGESGGWYEYMRKFGLSALGWEAWSRGELDKVAELVKRDNAFDMIIVDEAHNFRNEDTDDYALLSDICYGREVLLLTATPFNNRPGDLLALLHLFSPGKNSPFVPGGDLDERFRLFSKQYENANELNKAIVTGDHEKLEKALKKCGITIQMTEGGWNMAKIRAAASKYAKGITKGIRQVMEKIVIRRNRLDLKADPEWAAEITTLSTVQPPKEQYFELTREQDAFYDRVITRYFAKGGEFHGAFYHPQAYLRDQEGVGDVQKNLYKMFRNRLVQRFESSFGAFRKSLEYARNSMLLAQTFAKRMGCYIYSRKIMEKVMTIDDYESAQAYMIEEIRKLQEEYENSGVKTTGAIVYSIKGHDFNGKQFLEDLASDIALFDRIIKEVADLKLEKKDPKVAKLVSVIDEILKGTHPDVPAETAKRKILVFSAFTDTIDHIARHVEKAFPGRVLVVNGKNFGKEMAVRVKRNFDASFDRQDDDVDILLTTDKLSEGFNLNRAGLVVNYDIPWNPTRVIQRVGRINRIGKKIFENLYIFNFFPTVVGSTIVQNRQIAETKMFAIHQILGEDAQIFSPDEEPKAATLFDKLSSDLDDQETVSFYTEVKQKFAKAQAFLKKHHPEDLVRMNHYPSMVKTAWEGNPHVTISFRRQGPGFFAIAHSSAEARVTEWTMDEAIKAIECKYDTPRVPFSPSFWPGKDEDGKKVPGTYDLVKAYKPESLEANITMSAAVRAAAAINELKPDMSRELQEFATDVVEDIRSFGTIPQATLVLLAQCAKGTKGSMAKMERILSSILQARGHHYLDAERKRANQTSIVVTVEKQ